MFLTKKYKSTVPYDEYEEWVGLKSPKQNELKDHEIEDSNASTTTDEKMTNDTESDYEIYQESNLSNEG